MPLTRDQVRRRAAAAPPNLLGSPIRLEEPGSSSSSSSESSTKVQHSSLEFPRSLPKFGEPRQSSPRITVDPNTLPKPLQRYETPVHLIGKGLDNPHLLNAPKQARRRKIGVDKLGAMQEDGDVIEEKKGRKKGTGWKMNKDGVKEQGRKGLGVAH